MSVIWPAKHYFFCVGHISLHCVVFCPFKYISQFLRQINIIFFRYQKARIIGVLGYIIYWTDRFKISNTNNKERRFNSRPLHNGAINYLCERPFSPTWTNWFLTARNAATHWIILSAILRFFSLIIKVRWSTESNAFVKSIKMCARTYFLLT